MTAAGAPAGRHGAVVGALASFAGGCADTRDPHVSAFPQGVAPDGLTKVAQATVAASTGHADYTYTTAFVTAGTIVSRASGTFDSSHDVSDLLLRNAVMLDEQGEEISESSSGGSFVKLVVARDAAYLRSTDMSVLGIDTDQRLPLEDKPLTVDVFVDQQGRLRRAVPALHVQSGVPESKPRTADRPLQSKRLPRR